MLTYDMSAANGPMYKYLYECIRKDIEAGRIRPREKMPSKRTLAGNLGVSTITVENAYDQLIDEGYIIAEPRKGYFAANLENIVHFSVPTTPYSRQQAPKSQLQRNELPGHEKPANETGGIRAQGNTAAGKHMPEIHLPEQTDSHWFSFSSNKIPAGSFPFSIWARLSRRTLSFMEKELLEVSPSSGIRPLREAIAQHLASFRGMNIDPDQIIVGAGTEYLYDMLIKLLGTDRKYCIENPGYRKLEKIYTSCGADCVPADMDQDGILVPSLRGKNAGVAHISPTHHFPTGITMPAARRYELLAWANEKEGRYIIEDDYDSEFRLTVRPIPSLQSLDAGNKVIYMNTFSKSLASTIRISYMVLPPELVEKYYRELSFYSCTVPNIEQYTLAAFISEGYFEKHINRMRLFYKNQRKKVLEIIEETLGAENFRIVENHAGLHFMLELKTGRKDSDVEAILKRQGIKIEALSDFYMDGKTRNTHLFIINYSNADLEKLKKAVRILKENCF